jgi:large subunit ribosomal protein L22
MAILATRKPRRLEESTMSKPKRERSLAENEAKAVARMLRVSPQKLNLVAQLIRGRKASAALADLQFSRKRIAVDVKKCLESAIANAENIVMKRFSPRGRGRSGRIYKPFSHLTIVVRQVEAEAGA